MKMWDIGMDLRLKPPKNRSLQNFSPKNNHRTSPNKGKKHVLFVGVSQNDIHKNMDVFKHQGVLAMLPQICCIFDGQYHKPMVKIRVHSPEKRA